LADFRVESGGDSAVVVTDILRRGIAGVRITDPEINLAVENPRS
jgi:hypothetical protein